MIVKSVKNGSLKVAVFLYYSTVLKNKKCTNALHEFEQAVEEFGYIKDEYLKKSYEEENDSKVWTFDEYKKAFGWAGKAEVKSAARNRVEEVRDELVAEGFLWKKERPIHFGPIKGITVYVGLTEKGKKWAPKYIEKFGPAQFEKEWYEK